MFYIVKVEAKRGGFLYICIGSGCEPWQIALMVVTIILVAFCCCAGACFKSKENALDQRIASHEIAYESSLRSKKNARSDQNFKV